MGLRVKILRIIARSVDLFFGVYGRDCVKNKGQVVLVFFINTMGYEIDIQTFRGKYRYLLNGGDVSLQGCVFWCLCFKEFQKEYNQGSFFG